MVLELATGGRGDGGGGGVHLESLNKFNWCVFCARDWTEPARTKFIRIRTAAWKENQRLVEGQNIHMLRTMRLELTRLYS